MASNTTSRVAVVVATYGDREKWIPLAVEAMKSVEAQTIVPRVWHEHGDTLSQARNDGAFKMSQGDEPPEFLIFLDADDDLDERYVEEMLKCCDDLDLVQPATIGVHPDGHLDDFAVVIPTEKLLERNYLVIGTMVRRDLFERVGGFDEWPILEDWALWIKCDLAGARIGAAPDAVYRVHFHENSRNLDHRVGFTTYQDIRRWASKLSRQGL